MQSTAKIDVAPLDNSRLTRLQQAVAGLNGEQLTWASGYLAGLGALSPTTQSATEASPSMTILYATQGGNARRVAEVLAQQATDRGFAPRLLAADRFRPRDLAKERLLVVAICTQGEGEPPESARALFKYLNSKASPELAQLRYAIFGLGDSSYPHFCQAAKDLDALLKARGAHSLVDRIDADVDFQAYIESWNQQLLKGVEEWVPAAQARVIPMQRAPAAPRHDRDNPYQAELLERRRITTADALAEVHHLVLQVDASALSHQPGDTLGVCFRNDPVLVEEILSLTGLSGDSAVNLQGASPTLGQALRERLELTQLHPGVVSAWASIAGDPKLIALCEDNDLLRRFVRERQVVDLLRAYPATLDAESLARLLRPLQPRLYSIASSRAAFEDEIHLTVSTLGYRAHGRDYLGGASGYLTRRIAEGDRLGVYTVENPAFKLPPPGETPIVMIGAGTGVAPFRAFLQEREARGDRGPNWLVFGNRHFHRDFLYQTDWLDYRKSGLLNRISLAFSRDDAQRTYVQARLEEEGAELYRWLGEGAHLYVCGGLQMEQAVRQSLQAIVQARGGIDAEAAAAYVESLREQGRYQRDVY